jgi:alkylresorcinol/alkylpyrone synthase
VSTPAHIVSVATAVPDHAVSTDDVKTYFPKAFHLDDRRLAGIHAVIDHARIRKRHFVYPLDYIITPRPLEQTSCEFKTHSIALGQQVAEQALNEAGLTAADIDLIIAVSSTGLMIPSFDAHLVNLMGFRADVKRMPITELGCVSGAAAIARGADYIRAFPQANVLVVVVELPSLTLQTHDVSPANLISCCLFGDGAGAMVLSGTPPKKPGLSISATRSHIVPNSLEAMGFDLKSSGLHVFLSKNVPHIVREQVIPIVTGLLEQVGMTRAELEFFLLHPGGQKLLYFIEEKLSLSARDTACSWNVLAEYGNLASATILFVVKQFLSQAQPPRAGARGLMAGFGPGFTTEMALLTWA